MTTATAQAALNIAFIKNSGNSDGRYGHAYGAAARDHFANQLFYVQGKDWMAIAGVAILFLV